MTDANTLPRLLRLALDNPGDESALRRLTAELIRLGHDAPPTPTAEQIERAARGIAAALFEGVPSDEWRAGGQGAVAFFEGSDGETLGNIIIDYIKPSRDGSPLFVIALTPPHTMTPRGFILPRFCTFPINATFEAREALRQLRLAIDRNACEDEINYPGPTVPINYRGHALPESARTRAWRLLYQAREQSPFNLMTRCPRCNDMRPTEDLTADHPICADCRYGMARMAARDGESHISREVTVNNYGIAAPFAMAEAIANRRFDLAPHPMQPSYASWSAAPNPNLIDDILRQASALQAENDRANFHLRPNPDHPHILERVTELHITPGDEPFDTIRVPPETVDRLNQHLINLRRGYNNHINAPLRQELSGLGLTPEQIDQLMDDDT